MDFLYVMQSFKEKLVEDHPTPFRKRQSYDHWYLSNSKIFTSTWTRHSSGSVTSTNVIPQGLETVDRNHVLSTLCNTRQVGWYFFTCSRYTLRVTGRVNFMSNLTSECQPKNSLSRAQVDMISPWKQKTKYAKAYELEKN